MNSAADWYAEQEYRERCGMPYEGDGIPKQKITNADRIRQMTDEELAERFAPHMLCRICPKPLRISCTKDDCIKYALQWLKQEAKE